jgi:rod shape-determining protein MreD
VRDIVWTRLDGFARGISPFALTLAFLMAATVPLRVPDLSPILPSVGLIAVYYWLVHRPDLMPVWAVFLIGLIQDLLGGGPLGVGPFVLLVLFAAVTSLRRAFSGAGFLLLWLIFLPLAAGAFTLSWLFGSLIVDQMVAARPVFFQYLTTIAFYPCLTWIFIQAQRAFLK